MKVSKKTRKSAAMRSRPSSARVWQGQKVTAALGSRSSSQSVSSVEISGAMLRALGELFALGVQGISIKAFIMRLVDILHRVLAFDVVSIKFLDPKDQRVRYRYVCDRNGDFIEPQTILIEEKFSEKIIQRKKECFVRTNRQRIPFKTFAGLPLFRENELIGVISIMIKRPVSLGETERGLLQICASHLSLLLCQVEHLSHSEESYYRLFRSLIISLEAKDRYTRGHSQRVADLSLRIARKLNCTREELSILEEAAHLHDIGKIAIPDSILKKPGRLTKEEFQEIQSHVEKGEAMLRALGFNEEVIRISCAHHECYNGQGYPNKLKGEDIPLLARIINVADAYDAMTTDRPYRKALTREFAFDQLQQCAGVQFCPKVVEAFMRLHVS